MVYDNEPPVIHSITPSKHYLWPPNHKMIPITFAVSATDNLGPITYRITSITKLPAIEGGGDGTTSADWQVLSALKADLRAERSPAGCAAHLHDYRRGEGRRRQCRQLVHDCAGAAEFVKMTARQRLPSSPEPSRRFRRHRLRARRPTGNSPGQGPARSSDDTEVKRTTPQGFPMSLTIWKSRAALAAILAAAATASHAATFVVTTNADHGPGSLREAIAMAQRQRRRRYNCFLADARRHDHHALDRRTRDRRIRHPRSPSRRTACPAASPSAAAG